MVTRIQIQIGCIYNNALKKPNALLIWNVYGNQCERNPKSKYSPIFEKCHSVSIYLVQVAD